MASADEGVGCGAPPPYIIKESLKIKLVYIGDSFHEPLPPLIASQLLVEESKHYWLPPSPPQSLSPLALCLLSNG